MPQRNDDNKNTLDTTGGTQDQTSTTLTTDADAEAKNDDAPHQGRHDIGGYVGTK